jgi:mannitol-specific phosphotransferase system IIBC component
MSKYKFTDRIVLSFYPDDQNDMLLLDIINNSTVKRNRSNKIKDILLEYFKENNEKEYEKTKEKLNKIENNKQKQEKTSNKSKKESNIDINSIDNALDSWIDQ